MWDERYSRPGFAFGTAANDFLVEHAGRIPAGPVLSIGEGEGRNAAHLAGLGYRVTAVDRSLVGLRKARGLAEERGLVVDTVAADLEDFDIAPERWAGIVSIFCHTPPPLRRRLHRQVVEGLRPGGVLLLEAYTPRQLAYGTGGPPTPELLVTLEELQAELAGLDLRLARELEREVVEGDFHTGRAHVVQVVAVRPN